MATKPKTPPKAPAKAAAVPAIPPTGGGTDPAPTTGAADPVDAQVQAKVDQAIADHSAAAAATNEVNPQLVKPVKEKPVKVDIDHELALDRLDKIEDLAIKWGGDVGQQIRQLACEAMVALGKK